MKLLSLDGKELQSLKLPEQFKEDVRPDLIKRAVLVIQSHGRQPYGAYERAGKNYSATLSRRRKRYRGPYGIGISRVPRKIMTRRGRRMFWVGAVAPNTVGGRKAHPPKAEKVWNQKINKKERRKAIRSAIAATANVELVKKRGHQVPSVYPIALEKKAEEFKKTKQILDLLKKIGLEKELERSSEKKVRAGKGKMRGRKYRGRKGILMVVSKACDLAKAGKNIPGIDIVEVQKLNAEVLAPGADPGRLTLWTEDAIKRLEKEKLFTNNQVKEIKK